MLSFARPSHRSINWLTRKLLTIVALLGPSVCSGADPSQVFALEFTSLPSSQGFRYTDFAPPESSVFSVSGGILIQNSLGTDDRVARYIYASAFPYSNVAFTISFRARLLESEGDPLDLGFAVVFDNALCHVGVGLSSNCVFVSGRNDTPTFLTNSIDPLQFHDYVLTVRPIIRTWALAVDGTLLATGNLEPGSSSGVFRFGDLSEGYSNSRGEWGRMAFSYILLEPDEPPSLKIRSDTNEVRLAWRAIAGAFQLQRTSSLVASNAWGIATNSITVSNNQNFARVPLTASNQFFRLTRTLNDGKN